MLQEYEYNKVEYCSNHVSASHPLFLCCIEHVLDLSIVLLFRTGPEVTTGLIVE